MRFPEPGKAEVIEVPTPDAADGQVLVRVRAVGICASDVAAFTGKHDVRRPPVITGHEAAGDTVQSGTVVKERQPNERVVIEPQSSCGHCFFCRQGNYHECPQKRFLGVGDWTGAFAEFVVAPEGMCHLIPEVMSYEEGACLEPLCVGLHAVRRANIRLGESLAVLGVGTIGMATLLCTRLDTSGWIAVTDPSAVKRQMALRWGADMAVDPLAEDPVEAIHKATNGLGVDVVFIAIASDVVLDQAVRMCRRMGRIIVIASFFEKGEIKVRQIQVRERALLGSSMFTSKDYQLAIQLWKRGRLEALSGLVTERITLDDAPSAMVALAGGRKPDNLKTVIVFK